MSFENGADQKPPVNEGGFSFEITLPDDAVELQVEGGSIRITPAQAEVRLRRVGRVLVAEAEACGDLKRAFERFRDECLEDVASR